MYTIAGVVTLINFRQFMEWPHHENIHTCMHNMKNHHSTAREGLCPNNYVGINEVQLSCC